MSTYLHPHVCFECKKSFKRPANLYGPNVNKKPRLCPECGKEMICLSRNFKAPPKEDVEQWKKVKYLVDNGYFFQRIGYDRANWAKPPKTLSEAKVFIKTYFSDRHLNKEVKPSGKLAEKIIKEDKEKLAKIRMHLKSGKRKQKETKY